jgi:regulator of sigma E protease
VEALSMMTVIAWIVVFGVLIAVHELGHFTMAKVTGIRVDEFSLGFGPALWKRQWGETLYAVRGIPLGGYVRMAGMDGSGEDDPRAFTHKPLWQRFMVILAGPFMNLVLAAVLYVVLFGPVGIPSPTTTVGIAMAGYPAAQAGIRPGDQVVSVDGRGVSSWTSLATAIATHDQRPIRITVRRPDGTVATYTVATRLDPAVHQRIIGIQPAYTSLHLPVLAAIAAGFNHTVQITVLWFTQLGRLITGQARFDVSGPVGIAVMVGQAVQQGWVSLILLAAALSANLGLFNILPVPVLDGSKLWLIVIEAIRRRPLDPAKENLIQVVGLVVLLAFVLFVTYHDLLRLVG